ncbi:hypothetical protein [Thermosipho globiformans]|uniref:hypothetical protein n=1 Tax=Thermosipho globiformans TaxID=380685 RepID=UPI000F8C73D8|nr:hypothetical protein [Thermosipho globiformans]
MLRKLFFILSFLPFVIVFSINGPPIHKSNQAISLSKEIKVDVYQWIDISLESTPIIITDKDYSSSYITDNAEENGSPFFEMSFSSNANVNITLEFLDEYFKDFLGNIIDEFNISFIMKNCNANDEDSNLQVNNYSNNNSGFFHIYVTGDYIKENNYTVIFPSASSGKVIMKLLNLDASWTGKTKAGVYKLPIRFTFNPTVTF